MFGALSLYADEAYLLCDAVLGAALSDATRWGGQGTWMSHWEGVSTLHRCYLSDILHQITHNAHWKPTLPVGLSMSGLHNTSIASCSRQFMTIRMF